MTRIKQKMSGNNSQEQPNFDINTLLSTAQSMFSNISEDDKKKFENIDISKVLEHVSGSVMTTLEKSGVKVDPASMNQMKVISKMMMDGLNDNVGPVYSKDTEGKVGEGKVSNIILDNVEEKPVEDKVPKKEELFEVIDSDSEVDELQPIADDLYYRLPVTLEELYTGKKKKLVVHRERLDKSGVKVVSEKRKIEVPVQRGMKHGQQIRFNKEGNEKYGYRAGDIIISLSMNAHNEFERNDNTLCYTKNINLFESYALSLGLINMYIQHLDGTWLRLNVKDELPPHTHNGMKKIKGYGMPYVNRKTRKIEYGDLIVRFNLILPKMLTEQELYTVKNIFSSPDTVYEKKDTYQDVVLDEVTLDDLEKLEDYTDSDTDTDSDSDSDSFYSSSDSE